MNKNLFEQFKMSDFSYATVVNPKTGDIKMAKVGFSWTCFWFGVFPAIFRRDWFNLILMVLFSLVMNGVLLNINLQMSFLIVSGVFAIGYNNLYFYRLFKKGYIPADEGSKALLIKGKYLTAD